MQIKAESMKPTGCLLTEKELIGPPALSMKGFMNSARSVRPSVGITVFSGLDIKVMEPIFFFWEKCTLAVLRTTCPVSISNVSNLT